MLEQRKQGSLTNARRGACGLVSSPHTAHTRTARGLRPPTGCVELESFQVLLDELRWSAKREPHNIAGSFEDPVREDNFKLVCAYIHRLDSSVVIDGGTSSVTQMK